jgi:hypothetical protein
MALGFATTLRTNRATQVLNAIDGGTGAGTLNIYSGTRPATAAAITTQVLLGVLTFSDPCGTVTSGVLTFSAITQDASADATGTATWFRVLDGSGSFVMDGAITVTGGGGDMTLNTTSITIGGPISVTGTKQITEGNA